MLPVKGLTHIFLNHRRFRAAAYCHCKQIYPVTIVIYRHKHVDGYDNGLAGVSVDAHLPIGNIKTDNLIICPVNPDKIATRVATFREQFLIYSLSYHTDFPPGQYISLADITAIFNRRGFNHSIISTQAFYGSGTTSSVICCIASPHRIYRCYDIKLRYCRLQIIHIIQGKIPGSASVETFVWFGSSIRYNKDGIGRKSFKIAGKQLLQSTTSSAHHQKHENTPEHSEPGQKRPAPVFRECIKNLLQ